MTWGIPDFLKRHAVDKAEALLRQHGVEAPEHIRLEDMAEVLKIPLVVGSLSGAAARLTLRDGRAVIRINERDVDTPRARFHVGHEFGHLHLHPEKLATVCTEQDLRAVHSSQRNEIAANVFAANLLLPSFLAKPLVRRVEMGWNSILNLASRFRTSKEATAIRWVELTEQPCAVVCCTRSAVRWCVTSKSWRGRFLREGPLDRRSQVARLLARRSYAEEPEDLDAADIWLDRDHGIPNGLEIWEHARPFSTFDGALVLLWQVGDRDDDEDEGDLEEEEPTFSRR